MLQVSRRFVSILYTNSRFSVILLPIEHCRMALPSVVLRWKAALLRVMMLVTHWQVWSTPMSAVSVVPLQLNHLY